MYQAITTASQFRDAFRAAGRADQFSYEALGLLFDYLEEADPDFELDVIAICCDYSEDTVAEIAESYGLELPEDETEEEHLKAVREFLEDQTSIVAEINGGFIYCSSF